MGEQVAGPLAYDWLDRVCNDLEKELYSTKSINIPACAVDAPHIRHRTYWIAKSSCNLGQSNSKRWGSRKQAPETLGQRNSIISTGPNDTFWTNSVSIQGRDGKSRRIKPGIRLLAYGISSRVDKLRALGNAIVPQVAAEVIGSYIETEKVIYSTRMAETEN